ncbi:putative ABC transport system substrate-binding protein [Cupriavidus sp. YR651]|uniref:ABC transporter substrate-binding protein n=1 Tax=Cupriavidus sp. YR651 TaxID=1855315 RepID=UPI000880BC61|nr:ABC transporter substrate-binding protein [Cupriavidus sp. YR651]SDC66372.1 putative ABC transport system substrate-binding protein [Cupriavidus sp. YR651]
MERRTMLAGAAALTVGLTLAEGVSHAQQASRVFRVGVLVNGGASVEGKPNPQVEGLRSGLAQLGYLEGKSVVYEARFPDGQLDRLPGLAVELVGIGVDVIATFGGPSTNAARRATTTVPIVAALVADPVAIGVAATLERPGSNVTGATNNDPELASRQLAILKAILPKLARVAILSDSDIPGADASGLAPIERSNVAAARAAGLTPQVLKIRGPKPDLETAFRAMTAEGAEVLVVLEVPATIRDRKRIAELATKQRLPTMFWGGASDSGCLLSYGTSFTASFPPLPGIIDKILKGARPAETPFAVISQRELSINLKTAGELGLTLPGELISRADLVIK